jgi:hypothetical protein
MTKRAYRIGAVFYVLWGVLHIVGGAAMLAELRSVGPTGTMGMIASATPAAQLPELASGAHRWARPG